MIKVLFVCLGNICRSPMAEAVFRHLVQERGYSNLIEVDSAGTGNWHVGEPPHKGTQKMLKSKGIDFKNIKARQFTSKDFDTYNYIIAMDQQNVLDMIKRSPSGNVTVTRLMEERPDLGQENVPDPWYTGDFDETYRLVSLGTEALLDRIIHEHNLRKV